MNRFEASIDRAGYGELLILPQLALEVSGGELLVLLGANGAGKTTALRALVGTIDVGRRAISLDGEDLSALTAWQLSRRGVAFVPDGARCFANATVASRRCGLGLTRPSASACLPPCSTSSRSCASAAPSSPAR